MCDYEWSVGGEYSRYERNVCFYLCLCLMIFILSVLCIIVCLEDTLGCSCPSATGHSIRVSDDVLSLSPSVAFVLFSF